MGFSERRICVPTSTVELKVLIVSPDAKTTSVLVEAFRDLAVLAQVCTEHVSASDCFFQAKFEAVAVDLDTILEPIPFVQNIRQGRANRNAVVLAIATTDSAKGRASEHRASWS